jgi:peptidoglycan/xylan/chitin deacetylase (PgdA/CDA1 family)
MSPASGTGGAARIGLAIRKRWLRLERLRLARRLPPAAIVLLYHRVLPARAQDPFGLVVRQQRFAEHLTHLSAMYDVVPAARVADDLRAGRRPQRRQVAITFDDGYADNFLHAYPLLERLRLPATIFLATDYIDSDRSFWWDRLWPILYESATTTLVVPPPVDRVYTLTSRAARDEALTDLWERMVTLPEEARRALLQILRAAPGSDADRPLSWMDVRAMHAGGLVTFGAHGGSHPRLAALSAHGAGEEIERPAQRIAEELGSRPSLFAYPYGVPGEDFTTATTEAVRRAGFAAAFAAEPGVAGAGIDPFAIPRVSVGDWSVERLNDELLRVWTAERYLRA